MNRVMINIMGLNIYWYSVIILVAIAVGSSIAIKYSSRVKIPKTIIIDMILGLIISAIIGARTYFVIFNFDEYKNNIIDIFKIWEGGLAIYGGIIAGILYILYYSKKKKVSFVKLLDICSLSLLLGQAIGRWGNFFNGEAYGAITTYNKLKNMHIPEFIIKGMYINGAYRTPTFLYESIWCLIGILILFRIRKYKSNNIGYQTSFYMIWYGIGRFFIEGSRSDSLYFNNFKISQIVSIILIIIGLSYYIINKIKNKSKFNNNKSVGGEDGRI